MSSGSSSSNGPVRTSSVSSAFRFNSSTLAMTTASSGVISPVAIAAIRESNAATRSPGALISGKTNATARPFGRGATRSSTSLAAVMSHSLAASTTARTTSSISSCISFSASTVARLRAPLGLPAGLPDCPGSNCRPGPRLRCFFCAFLTIIVLTYTGARGFRGTDKFRLAARACSQVRRQAPRGQLSGMTALHLSHSHQHASELNMHIARLRAILYHATCRKLVRQIGGADHGRRDATVVENRAASRDSNPDEAGAFLIGIEGQDLAAIDRAAFDRGIFHSRQHDVDSVGRLAAHDVIEIDDRNGLADVTAFARRLEPQLQMIGRRHLQRRGDLGNIAERKLSSGRDVDDHVIARS